MLAFMYKRILVYFLSYVFFIEKNWFSIPSREVSRDEMDRRMLVSLVLEELTMNLFSNYFVLVMTFQKDSFSKFV